MFSLELTNRPAFTPIAILLHPVVPLARALKPSAVLFQPVILHFIAHKPTATF